MTDREGFERFFRERYARVVRACTLVILDPAAAEEVTAEAFARLWARWAQSQAWDILDTLSFESA